MTDLLLATAELVAIASESHDEMAITDHIERALAERAPWLVLDRIGNNLVARSVGARSTRVLLAGHTDTVPAARGNFPGHLEHDVLHGVGASDMKSGLAVMLELALSDSARSVEATYVFYEAEEVAAVHNGLGRLARERPDLLACDVALLGEPTDAAVEAGCQGTLRADVTFAGSRAHTARPWMGRNAIHRLAGALARLSAYDARRPLIDGCEFREAMQAVRVEGGVAGNVVPDRAVLTVNHRFAPDRTVEQALEHVRAIVAVDLEPGDDFRMTDASTGAPPALEHPLLRALISRNNLPVRAKLGWTDVARFAALGIPAANFGPGDATLAHMADERVAREPIERVYEALDDLLRVGA